MCASAVLLLSQHLLHGNCCLEVYNVCVCVCVRRRDRDRETGLENTLWMKLDFFHFVQTEENLSICVKYCGVCKAISNVYVPFEIFLPLLPPGLKMKSQ